MFHGLVQDCSNSIALAMELLQFYTKPLTWSLIIIMWPEHNGCQLAYEIFK